MLVERVAAAIREVGVAEVLPRFRALAAGDISEKSPGDLVTIADRECERVLSLRLRDIRDLPVVGEEATQADPSLLNHVDTAPAVWIVDPIDGTANFVSGSTDFAVMVALVEAGVTVSAWVWHPATDTMLTGELGQGTKRNGVLVLPVARIGEPKGILKRKYLAEPARSRPADFPPSVAEIVRTPIRCAGIEYSQLLRGEIDFAFYWRTLPWDHAPCALLAGEAGLTVARIDGSAYRPGDHQMGLLSARPELWSAVATEIRAALRAAARFVRCPSGPSATPTKSGIIGLEASGPSPIPRGLQAPDEAKSAAR